MVRIGAADPTLTPVSGMAAITELVECPGLIEFLDGAVGPIKRRNRGFGAGELLVGMASAQLAGEDFLAGMDRHRADRAGQVLTPVPAWRRGPQPVWHGGSPPSSGLRWRPVSRGRRSGCSRCCPRHGRRR